MCEYRYYLCSDCHARVGHPKKIPCGKEACKPKAVDVRKRAKFCAECKQKRDRRDEKARKKEEKKLKKTGERVYVRRKGERKSVGIHLEGKLFT
jgi:hypothetical protein